MSQSTEPRRRSSRGGKRTQQAAAASASAASRTASKRERAAATNASRTVSSGAAPRGRTRRGNDLPEIQQAEIMGRLLLAAAVAMAFVTVFVTLVNGGVVLALVGITALLAVPGAALFAVGRFRS